MRWLCERITKKLRIPNKVDEYWQGVSGSPDKCTDYFELHLLETINAPLALCLDEVDEVFKHPEISNSKFDTIWAFQRFLLRLVSISSGCSIDLTNQRKFMS